MENSKIGEKDMCSRCKKIKFIAAEDVGQGSDNDRYYCAECYEQISKDR